MAPSAAFRAPWWLHGPHAQTLGGRLLRSRAAVRLRRERLELEDGDFIDLDWATPSDNHPSPHGPLAVVLHGLEGSARSKYAYQAYRSLAKRGVSAVGLNFRSCSGEPNRLPRLYHSGDTGDFGFVTRVLRSRFPSRPFGAVGFSLGGNVLLKYLGEEADGAKLDAAAAVSVPFDLGAGADHMERGFSRLYRRFLVRKLKRKVRAKRRTLGGRIDVERTLAAVTFREFDNVATAPMHEFRDAEDYYQRSSSFRFLDRIRVPTLLVHALDDPFLPRRSVPIDIAQRNPSVQTRFTSGGGHVGFVEGAPWSPRFWAEEHIAEFIAATLNGDAKP